MIFVLQIQSKVHYTDNGLSIQSTEAEAIQKKNKFMENLIHASRLRLNLRNNQEKETNKKTISLGRVENKKDEKI